MKRICLAILFSLVLWPGCGVFVEGPWGGSWTDNNSGLTWMNPPANHKMEWQEAIDFCNGLSLDGHFDWRLPSISELRSLIRGCPETETGGSCGVTIYCLSYACQDSTCAGCAYQKGPAGGCYWPDGIEGPCKYYWSSSPCGENGEAWGMELYKGEVDCEDDYYDGQVRCVR